MTTRKPTIARGAVIERALVLAKIRRILDMTPDSGVYSRAYRHGLSDLSDWLKKQPGRTARKGGIGR